MTGLLVFFGLVVCNHAPLDFDIIEYYRYLCLYYLIYLLYHLKGLWFVTSEALVSLRNLYDPVCILYIYTLMHYIWYIGILW